MKKFLYYIIGVILCVFVLDMLNRCAYDKAFSCIKQKSPEYEEYIYQYYNNDCPIVILGASRAKYHYNPLIFERELKCKAYNLGANSRNIFQQYLCMKRVISKGSAKLVMLDLFPGQLSKEWYDRSTYFIPYYWKNNDIRKILEAQYGLSYSFRMCSSFYQYNSKHKILLKSLLGKYKETTSYEGFLGLEHVNNLSSLDKSKKDAYYKMDSLALSYLDKIIDMCNKNNIKLIAFCSPSYSDDYYFIPQIREYLSERNVDFYDYLQFRIVREKKLFHDNFHLDSLGADLYSKEISNLIKKRYKQYLY